MRTIPIDEDYSEEIDIIFNLFASVTISIDKKCLHNESDREDSIINFEIEQDEDGIEIVYAPYSSYCKPIDDTILTSEQQQFVNNYIYKYYVKSLFSIDANNDTVGYYSPVYLYLEKIPK